MQRYFKILLPSNPLRFQFDPRNFEKLLNFILQEYRFPNICGQLPSSAPGVATYLRLDGKFHTRTCLCAGSIDKARENTCIRQCCHVPNISRFLACPPMTAVGWWPYGG